MAYYLARVQILERITFQTVTQRRNHEIVPKGHVKLFAAEFEFRSRAPISQLMSLNNMCLNRKEFFSIHYHVICLSFAYLIIHTMEFSLS